MDDHCLLPYTCKGCIVFKQFDGLNFDGLAGKRQKRQNFALYGNRPPNRLLIVSTNLDGFSLANHGRFAKLVCQTFPVYGIIILRGIQELLLY